MASSLILQGGAVSAKSLKDSVTQVGHGFTVGDVVRWDPVATVPGYTAARADSATNAEVAGVVSKVDTADNFEITYHGYIEIPAISGISAPVWFLSATKGGSLDITPPSALGTVVKPVITRNSNGSGHLVMNYLGTQIGGSSTISIDEIQPVGTIIPFGGNTIPDTWLECNGSTYSISAYPELYSKITYSSGVRAPMYGHVVEVQLTTASSTLYANTSVGNYILINNSVSTPTATGYDLIGQVISKTTAISGSLGLTIQILPGYDPGTKTFSVPNKIVGSGNAIAVFSDFSLTVARSGTGSVNTVSMIAFNTPDLRGRFALGTNLSAISDTDRDPTFISNISGYGMAAMGGEEAHTLTTAEMAQHTHATTLTDSGHTHKWAGFVSINPGTVNGNRVYDEDFLTSMSNNGFSQTDLTKYGNPVRIGELQEDGAGGGEDQDSGVAAYDVKSQTTGISVTNQNAGSNTPHNNMPPYLAVRYIIKAKPYARAAIIDAVDIPYNNLLVRDLRTQSMGISPADLVFHVNTSSDLTLRGEERMRFSTTTSSPSVILTGSGDDDAITDVRIRESSQDQFIDFHSSVSAGGWNPLNLVGGHSIIFGSTNKGAGGSGITLTIGPWSNSSHGLVLSSNGRLGVNTNTPAVALDIVGEARSSVSTTSVSNAKTLVTKDYIDGYVFGTSWNSYTVSQPANAAQPSGNVASGTGQRINGTVYTNSLTKPILVVVCYRREISAFMRVGVEVGPSGSRVKIVDVRYGGDATAPTLSFIVPPNQQYVVSILSDSSGYDPSYALSSWAELR